MSENVGRISNELYSKFQSSHGLLYIGQSVDSADVKKYLSKLPWSAVFTTNHEQSFASNFATDSRRLQLCTSVEELARHSLSRDKPLLVQLYGIDGEPQEDESLSLSPFGSAGRRRRKAEALLSNLPILLDCVNSLVITGADSDEDLDLLDCLIEIIQNKVTPGSVSFWGMESAFEGHNDIKKYIKDICEQRGFGYIDLPLASAVKYRMEENAAVRDELSPKEIADDIFFIDQRPVGISGDNLLRIRNIGCLLTEKTVYRIQPLGRHQRNIWFSNFLELSGAGEPQWYGYLSKSSFHVKRDFEDPLVALVMRALRGRGIGDSEDSAVTAKMPIVLSGAPGSSKSVTLGALAYRIFNERRFPVLFVSGETFLGNNYGSGYRSLVDALEVLHQLSDNSSSVLLVWDGSCFLEIESVAKKLLRDLGNRGRNVVLVCSSYSLGDDDPGASFYSFDANSKVFVPCGQDNGAVVIAGSGCIFVKAGRDLSDKEQYSFWQKAKSFSGISEEQISYLKRRLANDNDADIFNHYYYLISLLRERLASSLEGEQNKVSLFLQNEMPDYFMELNRNRKIELQQGIVWKALENAGMSKEQLLSFASDINDSSEQNDWSSQLTRANTYIAFFSRYKIDIPYGFVYRIITEHDDVNPYGEDGRELFDILTKRIPWLSCGENNANEFVFRFRNSLEASIFLERHGVNGQRLVEMVVEILELYGELCGSSRYDDSQLAQKIQAIVRLMGPNGRYYSNTDPEYIVIRGYLNNLIDALEKLLRVDKVVDSDCGFALLYITLTREFYGKNIWNPEHEIPAHAELPYGSDGFMPADFEMRLGKIGEAASYAMTCENKVSEVLAGDWYGAQRSYLNRQANSLIVESALCNLELDDLRSQYFECCKRTGYPINPSYEDTLQPYSVQYRKLSEAIRKEPLNGYAYNSLFKLFEREYLRDDAPYDRKIEYLTEIMPMIDSCLTYGSEIENRGAHRDELSEHLVEIGSFADNIPASIDMILNRAEVAYSRDTSEFLKIYDWFLEKGNPAAILFVCHKEIGELNSKENIDAFEIARCQKALEFMTEQTRFNCVSSDPNALAFLIRTAWLAYNRSSLSEVKECQTTSLSIMQWRELYRYCDIFHKMSQPTAQFPLLNLVFALATLQVGGRDANSYSKAYSIIQRIEENQFFSQYRMKTPFIVCDENGRPIRYTGTVLQVKDRVGYMRVDGMPTYFGGSEGVYFRQFTLGHQVQMPEVGEVVPGLELGLGYRGFVLFSEQGRKEIVGRYRK